MQSQLSDLLNDNDLNLPVVKKNYSLDLRGLDVRDW